MQGYEAGSCDIVFATNVLHATRNMGNTLAHSKVCCQSFSAAHETPLLDGATLWEPSIIHAEEARLNEDNVKYSMPMNSFISHFSTAAVKGQAAQRAQFVKGVKTLDCC